MTDISGSPPSPRENFFAFTNANCIYVFGGYSGKSLNDLHILDLGEFFLYWRTRGTRAKSLVRIKEGKKDAAGRRDEPRWREQRAGPKEGKVKKIGGLIIIFFSNS
jgi:hypothetical protein